MKIYTDEFDPENLDIEKWLREENSEKLQSLYNYADSLREKTVGDEVHIRGLLEITSFCSRSCMYCGMRKEREINRYRLTREEILESADFAIETGYETLVIQGGEDFKIKVDVIAEIIKNIKAKKDIAITLSLGERKYEELKLWKEAGANRYLLRFETSNMELLKKIHPCLKNSSRTRIDILRELKELGYETGSGVMVGIPGQTYEDLAQDIKLFRELNLHMIGLGPFIPHPATPLGNIDKKIWNMENQVKPDETMVYKVLALTRIIYPGINIPATSALTAINMKHGMTNALRSGANVFMVNITPERYWNNYDIYDTRNENPDLKKITLETVTEQIHSIGRKIGVGRGDSSTFTLK